MNADNEENDQKKTKKSFGRRWTPIDADQAQSKNGNPRAKANSIGRRWTPMDAD
jgi:hypothetical protein